MANIDFGMNVINWHCNGGGGNSTSLDIFDENGMIKAELIPGGVATSTFVPYMSTNPNDTPKDVQWIDVDGNSIIGTLVANESTMGRVYFVLQNIDANSYNQYAVFRTGEEGSYEYEWKCIGSGIYDVTTIQQLDDRVAVLEDNATWKDA
jgi:hypothetical protein